MNARGFGAGTVIDWEDVFGLPETTSSFRVEGHFKIAPRHRLRASYFKTNRAADRVLIDRGMPLRNVGLGVGYLYTRVDLDILFGSGPLQNWKFKYNTGGLTAYGLVSF